MTPSEPLLQVRDLRVDVGERRILKSVSLDVPAGALLVRDFAMLEPEGGQEQGYRAGTENLPAAAGFAAAINAADKDWFEKMQEQRDKLAYLLRTGALTI